MKKKFKYTTTLHEIPEKGGAYVIFPWNIRELFGKGRLKVNAKFDEEPYTGSIVNMGIKNENREICYIIGVLKSIRQKLGKKDGDEIEVEIEVMD